MRKMRRPIKALRSGRLGFVLHMTVATLLLLAASVAGRADEAPGCQNLPTKQTVDTKWPINIGVLAPQLIRYRCTDYMTDFAAVTDEAHAWIAQRAPQVENAAVVFDIDETALSNWARIYHNQFGYVAIGPCKLSDPDAFCGDSAWGLSLRATALQPTLELFRFLKTVKDKYGKRIAVFFITGRYESAAERRRLGLDQLWEAVPGSSVRIDSMHERDRKLLEYFDGLGIRPGVPLRVVARNYDGTLTLRLKKKTISLGEAAARKVWVSKRSE